MGIREVAKMASVSTATVSRLITGAARVSPKTATRVVHAMQALNFQPNEAARLLAFQKKLNASGSVPRDCRSGVAVASCAEEHLFVGPYRPKWLITRRKHPTGRADRHIL